MVVAGPGRADVVDPASGEIRRTIPLGSGVVTTLVVSPDGATLATATEGSDDVRLWDADTGEPVATIQGHRAPVTQLAFSPNGLVSAGDDASVLRWQTDPDQAVAMLCRTLADHPGIALADTGCG